MKHVTNQRKRKRWLAPLALCLAVCLAIHPVSLNVVQAAQSDVDAFWEAADAYWGEDGKARAFWTASDKLFWGNEDEGIIGAMDEYYKVGDDTEARDAARKKVQDAIAAYKAAYLEVKPAFEEVKAKFEALSPEDKDDVLPGIYETLCKTYNGDGTEEYIGVEIQYKNECIDIEIWNYWDNEFQYQNAFSSFGSALEALYGNDEKGISGAIPAYNEAIYDNNGDIDAVREAVMKSMDDVKDAYALIDKFYAAMDDVYGKTSEEAKSELQDSYTGATESRQVSKESYEETLININILEYMEFNVGYGKARAIFWESTNNFWGNERENIAGAHPTYMAALESGAEELDALYKEVLAARAAVEEAYETMTVKYQAENEAYEALADAAKQAFYGDSTVAKIHTGNVNDYTTGWVPETYKQIHECEIPAPGQNFAIYDGCTFTRGEGGQIRCYAENGDPVINEFKCDGVYTYYFQLDGTAMKDRLTYHPDGVHVIYFDKDGHEVFSDFANVRKSIEGKDVDDMCFFDTFGYMYVDTLTYDKSGTKLYYVNPYGVLERKGWFEFSGNEFNAGLGFSGRAGGYGYANADCSLMTNTDTYDWDDQLVYIQGDGHMFRD